MLEKSLGLLSLLLVLINAHRPLIEVSLTGHTHDRAPSAPARAPRAAARPRARRIDTTHDIGGRSYMIVYCCEIIDNIEKYCLLRA